MTDVLSRSLVRIFHQGDDAIVGTGFLVADNCVLTCTHVVNEALGRQSDDVSSPEAPVTLDFPLLVSGEQYTAHVRFWFPKQSDELGDIALLHLDRDPPPGATEAQLVVTGDHQVHSWRVYGFPLKQDGAVWATGVLHGPTATGWVQLEDVKRQAYAIQQGFSGGAVWDEQCEGVVGMVVAVDTKAAFMIPSSLLVKTCPALQASVIDDLKNYLQVGTGVFSRLPRYYPPGRDFVQMRQYVRLREQPLFYQDEQASSRKPDEVFTEQEVEAPPLDWEEFRVGLRCGIILGEPGMGKSWLLRYEWLRAAKKLASSSGEQQAGELPLYLRLPLLAEALATGESNVHEAILRVLEREYGWHQRLVRRVKDWLTHGHCLFCCDGLDEVAHEQRGVLVLALEQVVREDGHRMLITSRSTGYRSPFRTQGNVREVELVGLEQGQVDDFIERWFSADTARALQLQELLQREAALHALASSPLLLSFLCRIYDTGGRALPTTRSVLFERVLRLLLESTWHDPSSPPDEERLEQKLTLLKQIAWHFAHTEDHWQFVFPASALTTVLRQHRDGLTTLPPHQSLLEELSERDGVLVKAGATSPHLSSSEIPYTFLHRSFHEYLVASYLADQPVRVWKQAVMAHCWFEPEWEQVIVLLAGCLKQPQMLIETLCQEPDDVLHHLLLLSARCLVEADRQRVRGDLRQQVANALLDLVRSSLWDGMHQYATVLGQLGEPTVIPALVQALDEPHIRVQLGAIHALGGMQGASAEPALLWIVQDGSRISLLRAAAMHALGRMGAVRALPTLLRLVRKGWKGPSWCREHEVAQALGAMGEPAVQALAHVLADPDAEVHGRRCVAIALGFIGQASAPALLEALQTLLARADVYETDAPDGPERRQARWQEEMVLEAVIKALGQVRTPSTHQALVDLLQHGADERRLSAVEALARQGARGEAVLQGVLLDMDEGPDLRLRVAELLVARGSEETVRTLLDVAYDEEEESDLRLRAIEHLGTIGHPAAVEDLDDVLTDEDDAPVIRAAALLALTEIGDASLLTRLTGLLRNGAETPEVRLAAAQALGRMGERAAVGSLLEVIERADEDDELHEAAIEALGALGNEAAVPPLLRIAQDPQADANPRLSALCVLGSIGDASAIQGLTALVQTRTEKQFLRCLAVQALGALGDARVITTLLQVRAEETTGLFLRRAIEEVLPRLIAPHAYEEFLALLQQESQEIELRRVAVQALGKIGDARSVDALLLVLREKEAVQQTVELPEWQVEKLRAGAMLLRCDAAEALGKIGDTRAVEGMMTALLDRSEDWTVHKSLVQALGNIGGERAIEGLLHVFQYEGDEGWHMMIDMGIVQALAHIGGIRVVERVLYMLQTSRNDVKQSQAARALQEIIERANDIEGVAEALLISWEHASTRQIFDDKAHTFALTVHCELLMLMRYQLRAAVGDDWPAWRKHLMGPTRYMRVLGKRAEKK